MFSQALQVRHIIQKKGRVLSSKTVQKLSQSSFLVCSTLMFPVVSLQNRHAQWVIFFVSEEILHKPWGVHKNCSLIFLAGKDHTKDVRLIVDFNFRVPGIHHISNTDSDCRRLRGERTYLIWYDIKLGFIFTEEKEDSCNFKIFPTSSLNCLVQVMPFF